MHQVFADAGHSRVPLAAAYVKPPAGHKRLSMPLPLPMQIVRAVADVLHHYEFRNRSGRHLRTIRLQPEGAMPPAVAAFAQPDGLLIGE
jgi:hypothetical protein